MAQSLIRNILESSAPSESAAAYPLGFDFPALITGLFPQRLKAVAEFRADVVPGQRTSNVETMSGGDTAGVLLNLKNHHSRVERKRYQDIVTAFTTLFPRYSSIEAVEPSPGSGQADVQFLEERRENPLTLTQVSAGIKQILTLLTVLIGRDGLVLFVEHPEQHLHPHGMRYLKSLLVEASARNQIIVVTHDPHFVDPGHLTGLRRFWWTVQRGTEVYGLDLIAKIQDERTREVTLSQCRTVFRNLANRELVFARAVMLAPTSNSFFGLC